jgi:uroporphyrinogen decarboxylase
MEEMTKRERVMAAVRGEPVDRVPVSFFNHNYLMESSTDRLAAYLLEQHQKFGWDFLKATLRPSYYAEAWGCKVRFYHDRVPEKETYVIKSADDFRKLEKLDPTKGVFGEHVKVAEELEDGLKGSVPFIMTLFSPLTVAGRLAGGVVRTSSESGNLRRHMEENPEAVQYGLSIISETLCDYARELIRAGADGIFLSTSVWSRDAISEENYKIFGKPYDLAVYQAAIREGATFNVLHICRENIILDLLSDYPVQVVNYEATSPRNPSLKEVMNKTDKTLWGGLDHRNTLLKGPVDAIVAEVHAALEQTGGRRFILGPGCTSLSQIPEAHYVAAKEALFAWGKS